MRKFLSIFIILCTVCSITACSKKKKEEVGGEEEPETVTISVAVRGSADDPLYKLLETFKTEVETNTNNEVAITLTTATELGVEGKEQESVTKGDVDIVFLPRESVQENSIWLEMFDAWFMFLNYDHYRQTFDDKAGDIMFSNIRSDQNLQILGTLYEDMKVFNVRSDASLYTIDDFDSIDLGVSPSEQSVLLAHTLGANPLVIVESSINRYLADQTINGFEAYFKDLRESKYYEQTNSIVMSEHGVDFSFIAMNTEKWDMLTSSQKDAINVAITNVEKGYDEAILTQMQDYMTFYLGYGLSLQKLNKVEFHEAFSDLYRGNVELTNNWNIEYYERILKIARKMITDNNGIIE